MTSPIPAAPAELKFVDAAFAANITGGPYDGVVFYIGGDALHVWTLAELNSRDERFRLPAWVRSNPGSVDPRADAMASLSALNHYGVPRRSLVALDSETSIDPQWVKTFVTLLNQNGYPVIDYGSTNDVFQNQNPDGYYWAASWTGTPHLVNGSQMTQWVSFRNDDLSVAEPTLPFWDTRPTPPPPPPGSGVEFGFRRCLKCQCIYWPETMTGMPLPIPCAAGGHHQPEPRTEWGIPFKIL